MFVWKKEKRTLRNFAEVEIFSLGRQIYVEALKM